MASLYTTIIRPIFFRFDPELVHDVISASGSIMSKTALSRGFLKSLFYYEHEVLKQEVHGVHYNNPVGLAAGFDKDAKTIHALPSIGFGHATVGSVTYSAYAGNPKPRLTRLPKSKGVVVYYGLKNDGVKKVAPRIKKEIIDGMPITYSIAKTNSARTSKTEHGIKDYYLSMKFLEKHNYADVYEINISCPNTFGGEPFTSPEKLEALLEKLSHIKTEKPRYIKMPINLPWNDFKQLLDVAIKYGIEGVNIGNLTKERESELIKDEIKGSLKGGISGKPTKKLSEDLIKKTYEYAGDKLTIIGTGGIFTAEDAYRKIRNGATLIELITGMIYEGPQVIKRINKGLVKLLEADGFCNITEAIGVDTERGNLYT